MYITANCKLPCGGNENGGIPENLIVRNATVSEWKSIISASSKVYRYIALWKLCDQTPGWKSDIDISKLLHPTDIAEISKMARVVTISPMYNVSFECPHCKKKGQSEINIAESEFERICEPIEKVEFEYNGAIKVAEVSFLTEGKILELRDYASKMLDSRVKADPRYDVDIKDIIEEFKPYFRVKSIDGQSSNMEYFNVVLPNLSYSAYCELEEAGERVQHFVKGLPNNVKCPNCGKEFSLYLPLSRVLFHK